MDWFDLSAQIEQVLYATIREKVRKSWNEDHITFSLTEELAKSFHHIQIDSSPTTRIVWEGYKIRKPAETYFGDLGILVRIKYLDGAVIDGAGFLEAKVRVLTKNTFDALKFSQLKRMIRRCAHHQLLLYDYDDIIPGALLGSPSWWNGYPSRVAPITSSVVVPSNLAYSMKDKTRSIYRAALPLSYLITHRYFRGLDLEFDKNSLDVAKGLSDEYGSPTSLIVVSISKDGEEPSTPEVNTDIYQRTEG